MSENNAFEGWAVLELMGHRRLAGYVSEQEIAGAGMIRIDVPGSEAGGEATQFYSPSALYCLTPTTEETVRAFAARHQPSPVQRWELPAPTESEPVGEMEFKYEDEAELYREGEMPF